MLHPFGDAFDGFMVGTKTFPALHLPKGYNFLPLQRDGFNCGIGVAAVIGIVLRDVVHKDRQIANAGFSYDDLFSVKTLSLETCDKPNEVLCKMPEICFDALPTHVDYLALVREQWFRLFDVMAEAQHVTIPTDRLGDGHKVEVKYREHKNAILTWSTSSVADTKNLIQPRNGPKQNPPNATDNSDGQKESHNPANEGDMENDKGLVYSLVG
jgi:hypothetical protein